MLLPPNCDDSPRPSNSRELGRPQPAFDAIASTMPLGSVGYEAQTNERGERLIWLPRDVVDRLRHLRGPGESFSDAIIRLAEDVGAA
jgi:hypothetical protein